MDKTDKVPALMDQWEEGIQQIWGKMRSERVQVKGETTLFFFTRFRLTGCSSTGQIFLKKKDELTKEKQFVNTCVHVQKNQG